MSGTRKWTIRVPGSSANIGPGFDVLGLALSVHLTLRVTLTPSSSSNTNDSEVKLEYTGEGAEGAPLDPFKNLITRVALYVLLSNSLYFPQGTLHISVDNRVPFGRGLGSSAAAVVAGVCLASAVGNLQLSRERIKDYALMVERHPDNVTAALCGGFTGSFLRSLLPSELSPSSIPLAEVLPSYPPDAGPPKATDPKPPLPPKDVGRHVEYAFSERVGVVVVVPKFEVETAKARGALPLSYDRADVVFNLQRLAVLTSALGASEPSAALIHEAMRDRIHQPHRESLIPGLAHILKNVTPTTHPGLLGLCLSGAGPTLLALVSRPPSSSSGTITAGSDEITLGAEGVTEEMRSVGEGIKSVWREIGGVEVEWMALEVDREGAVIREEKA